MRWSQIRKMALSLPVALLAALLLVGITQSNISMPRFTPSTRSSGVPTPIK